MSLWHKDYFELQAIKTQQIEGKLYQPLNCLHLLYMGTEGRGCAEKSTVTRGASHLRNVSASQDKRVFQTLLCLPVKGPPCFESRPRLSLDGVSHTPQLLVVFCVP